MVVGKRFISNCLDAVVLRGRPWEVNWNGGGHCSKTKITVVQLRNRDYWFLQHLFYSKCWYIGASFHQFQQRLCFGLLSCFPGISSSFPVVSIFWEFLGQILQCIV